MSERKILIGMFVIAGILMFLNVFGENKEKSVQPTQIVPASGDGFIKSFRNPVIVEGESGSWRILNGDPTVVKDGNTYKMWFTGVGDNGFQQIAYAVSRNGIDWNVHPNPVFSRGEAGSWDRHAVETAFVMKDGETYKLWYSGWTTEDIDEMLTAAYQGKNILPAIGYATSKDGINWTRYDKPVIGQQKGILWRGKRDDFLAFADPHIIKEDGIYKMWFQGNGGNKPYEDLHEIGYATSKDGINWNLHPDNPVFKVGKKGSFESLGVFEPSIVRHGDTYEMWYGASPTKDIDGTIEGIKTLKAYIGRATSKDGIHWIRDPDNPIFGPEKSGSSSWKEDGAFMPTVILDGDTLRMWYVGVGRKGKWYPKLTRGLQYQIGYAEKKY